jgi:TPR repeat protein
VDRRSTASRDVVLFTIYLDMLYDEARYNDGASSRLNAEREEMRKVMSCILMKRFCTASLAGLVVLSVASTTHAEDPVPLPPAVSAALHQTIEAQRSGDLVKYAGTIAAPLGPVFRIHADSATKVGEAKKLLSQALSAKFGAADDNLFAYAFDDAQSRAANMRLIDIRIDDFAPSGDNFKLNVTTTIRAPDGGTRAIPQGFLAIQKDGIWKVQDLAAVARMAQLKKGAETNWEIFRAFSTMATDVNAGKYASRDAAVGAVRKAYDRLTDANASPPAGMDLYRQGSKQFQAGDFSASLASFTQSANLGYPHAACMVAIHYADGLGIKEDTAKAVEWYRKDIAKNDPVAENHLGSMLLEGAGVPKDTAEGLRLLKLSADQDCPPAFLNIGRAYLFGFGVPKDRGTGMMWYGQAADRGNSQAAYFVKWLAQAPGNQSFKDENQAVVFNRIMLMRARAMSMDVDSRGLDGRYHPADPAGAAALRAEADRMAREVGLD